VSPIHPATIDLREIWVPSAEWVALEQAAPSLRRLSELEERRLDEAPVLSAGVPVGIVATNVARCLVDAGSQIDDAMRPATDATNVLDIGTSSVVPLDVLLGALADRTSVLVRSGGNAWPAFISYTDLNRHPVRAALFGPLCVLEECLARTIQARYPIDGPPSAWPWLRYLSEDHQARLIGYWHLSTMRGVDLHPTQSATLSQLVQIVERDRALLTAVGATSATQFRQRVGTLPELRNRIMHPVKGLVLRHAEVAKWRSAVRAIGDLMQAASAVAPGTTGRA
jgi:hypothetical protein